jgi:dipeptidase E
MLYLSSYRLGDHIEKLLSNLPKTPRVFIVANALDVYPEAYRLKHKAEVYDPNRELEDYGCQVSDLDLRQYFGQKDDLANHLMECDLVWVLGGNSFVLRRAMALSGFDISATQHLEDGNISYGGFSAGAVVTAPSLRGIDLMDDPHTVPTGYQKEVVWSGMNWIDFSIVPHFQSNHPESELANDAKNFLTESGIPHRAISDGEVIFAEAGSLEVLPRVSKSS